MPLRYKWPLGVLLLIVSSPLWAAQKVDLDYHVQLLPQSDQAQVRVTLAEGSAVRSLDFDLGVPGNYSDFKADGQWQLTADPQHSRGLWHPAPGKASLSYRVQLNHPLKNGSFDTRITPKWALFRGEQLIPPASLDQQDGTELVSRLEFELPKGWKSVETAWPRIGKNRFRINDVSRLFDRPTGWILAGTLGSRRTTLGETEVTVSAPQGQGMHRMDVLTLLTFVWPQVQAVFPRNPPKLLIVGAGSPMWKGSTAARNSIYLYSGLPLVSESGSSPLLREVVQVFSGINDEPGHDWIGEGLSEYYAIELLRRAGGMSEERYQALQHRLNAVGKGVTHLRGAQTNPPMVARAVMLLQALDREIRLQTHNKRSLDDVSQALMRMDKVNTQSFIQLSESVLGGQSEVLDSPLLR
ncbi:hypothetical protein [Pseudomonas sp. CCC3.1]|uniref:hypothetical protein n=1 Tax=Pseudomonas sp. CCC3.1 TaxID=3048607 RepID=UPI002AC9A166|nr:hypothetical protein [Pseudomonas sp. CCC3.1]MEB0206783.1 hypothetical protein [Pseudomonas sp. CCC3.1]WPX37595.1 hypothetical protein RHM56_05265 [Pseudomonas sp. CCC3.1]